MLHGKSEETLRGLYKSAFFVVKAICFWQTGIYMRHQTQLREEVSAEEGVIVDTFLHMKNGGEAAFDEMSQNLVVWAQNWIKKTK